MGAPALPTELNDLAALKAEIGFRGSRPELVRRVEEIAARLGDGLPPAMAGFVASVGEYAASGVEAPATRSELHDVAAETADLRRLTPAADVDAALDGLLVPEPGGSAAGAESSLGEAMKRIVRAAVAAGIERIEERRGAYPRLPWRHRQQAIPGVVEPLDDDHDGLVHGGVIHARDFRLVVRAFRYGTYSETRGIRRLIDVVGGVCEKRDLDGDVLETWTTASRLHPAYASASVELPRPFRWGANGDGAWEALYRPSSAFIHSGHQLLEREPVPVTDDGLPDPLYYLGKLLSDEGRAAMASGFRRAPAPAAAIENPFFQVTPARDGLFAIESPFVSVFVPGAGAEDVLVAMADAFRDARFVRERKGLGLRLARYDREQRWRIRLFS